MYKVEILKDSVYKNSRLTTFELTYPRFVHSEFMTHRLFSRNSSSSRAIPAIKMIERVEKNPAIPIHWGKNQKGMAAEEEFEIPDRKKLENWWLDARDEAVKVARQMVEYGVHKQVVNRLLEPFSWITVICTATNYQNFFYLRCDKAAQPEIRLLADMMKEEYDKSTPKELPLGAWHTPLILEEEEKDGWFSLESRLQISVARCARVSYLTHDGRRDIQADIDLYNRLLTSKHMSPFEHIATPAMACTLHRNFNGWIQFRAVIEERENYISCR